MLLWEKHELEYGTKPQFCVNIPGNVVITGLFSAFCNSNIISANGSPALCVTVSEAQGSIVRIVNNRTNDHKHFSISSSKFKKEDKWANYVKGIVSVLRESNYHVGALNFSIDGPYLNSDTLHLASAIAVGVVLAFDKAFSLNIPRYEMVKICVRALEGLSNTKTLHSFLTDLLCGEEGNYSVFDSKTTTHYVDPFNGGDYLPLLINTNVPPEALREELKNRVFLVVDAVKELRAYYSDDIRNLTTADIYDRTIPLSEQYRKVCRFVMESGKVASIVSKLIVSKDCNQIGKTLYRLGKEMRETLDLSCPEVDWVIKRCAEIPGCSGAFFVFDTTSLSVLAIVSKSSLEELNEKLTEFEKIFGYKVEVSTFEPKGSAWISTEE